MKIFSKSVAVSYATISQVFSFSTTEIVIFLAKSWDIGLKNRNLPRFKSLLHVVQKLYELDAHFAMPNRRFQAIKNHVRSNAVLNPDNADDTFCPLKIWSVACTQAPP